MEKNKSRRPYVVCHMLASLDGRIDGEFFSAPETTPALNAYGKLRNYYGCQATLYGRTTMLGGYANQLDPQYLQAETFLSKEDFINPEGKSIGNFIVSMDPTGILGFSSHVLVKKGRAAAHVIEVLTEEVSSAYLSYLQRLGISYLFAGKKQLDCRILLEKLAAEFGINKLMVAGGGVTNWSFLREGLLDELSLVIAPVADGNTSAVSIFEQADFLPVHGPTAFHLKAVKALDGDAVWLRYCP